MVTKRYFTPEEANRTLPLVRMVVQDVLETGQAMRELLVKLGEKAADSQEVYELEQRLNSLLQELESIGCSYRDWNFSVGLVDFPALLNDHEVLLCWRSDEPSVQFYHDAKTGYAGRKPISDDLWKSVKK